MNESAAKLHDAEALVARLAAAKRLQPIMTRALGMGEPLPSEVARLDEQLDKALDAYEAAWKEAHGVTVAS